MSALEETLAFHIRAAGLPEPVRDTTIRVIEAGRSDNEFANG